MHGMTLDLRWSPDSSCLAFVSYRGDHSFVAVYSVTAKSLNYLDPSTDVDWQLCLVAGFKAHRLFARSVHQARDMV